MASIELRDFMRWAFGEELVHVAGNSGGGWNYIAAFAALGTVIDSQGYGGPLPDIGDVHPDAQKASEAVMLLASEDFALPSGWNPFPDLNDPHGLIAAAVEEVLARRAMRDAASLNANLIGMVISFAVMGREPEWRVEQPKFRLVERSGMPAWFVRASHKDVFGRVYEYETDGFNAKSRRPMPGAYRKYELCDPFQGAVQARIDWYLWAKAVNRVAERLETGLKAHRIVHEAHDCEIWKNSPSFAGSQQELEKVAK